MFQTVLFVDEVHRWNKAQQEILLPAIEDGSITLIGATTENPYHSLVSPLLSRCLLLRLDPLEPEEIRGLLEIAVVDAERGMGALGVTDEIDYDRVPNAVNLLPGMGYTHGIGSIYSGKVEKGNSMRASGKGCSGASP
jgi:replication-associated recombination protein RarA